MVIILTLLHLDVEGLENSTQQYVKAGPYKNLNIRRVGIPSFNPANTFHESAAFAKSSHCKVVS